MPLEYDNAENPFVGSNLPSHVEIEIAVLEEKLLKEVQQGMDQQLEGLGVAKKYDKRLEYIRENSDRVYFFKQLVRVNYSKGGVMIRHSKNKRGAVLVVALIMLAMLTFLTVAFVGSPVLKERRLLLH